MTLTAKIDRIEEAAVRILQEVKAAELTTQQIWDAAARTLELSTAIGIKPHAQA